MDILSNIESQIWSMNTTLRNISPSGAIRDTNDVDYLNQSHTNYNEFDTISDNLIFNLFSPSRDYSASLVTTSLGLKSRFRKTLSNLSKLFLALATFLASIGLVILKIHVRFFKWVASAILNISIAGFNFLFLPNMTQKFKYIPELSPIHHPLVKLNVSDDLKKAFDRLPLNSHMVLNDKFIVTRVPDYDS